MSSFLPFLLKGSFILPNEDSKSNNIIEETEINDNSNLNIFINSILPTNLKIKNIFEEIYQIHLKKNKPFYSNFQNVVIIPQKPPQNIYENIMIIKLILGKLLNNEQTQLTISGNFKKVFQSLNKLQIYILNLSLNHFNEISLIPNLYNTNELKTSLIRSILSFYSPDSNEKLSNLFFYYQFFDENSKPINLFISGSNIKNLKTNELFKYTEEDHIFNNYFTLHKSNNIIKFYFNDLNKNYLRRSFCSTNSKNLIINSFLIQNINTNINEETAKNLSLNLSNFSIDFIFSVYSIFSNMDQKKVNILFESMLKLFAYSNQHLKLIKLLSFYELRRTNDTNELFRKNNCYIRSVIQYINLITKDFKLTTIKELFKIITSSSDWSFDHPNDIDLINAKNLIIQFWKYLISKINTIPPSIRSLCRFLRLLSEREFRSNLLNHRAIFALLLLRFLFVSLTAPEDINDPNMFDPRKIAKSVQFTKLLAFVGQMTTISGENKGDRTKFNSIIEETSHYVVEFYEELCKEVEIEKFEVSIPELIEASNNFKYFIFENEKKLIDFEIDIDLENSFSDEFITEFILHKN